MADENHLIEIQVGETGADQVASKLGQVDTAADKIPNEIQIKIDAKIEQALSNLATLQSRLDALRAASVNVSSAEREVQQYQSSIDRYKNMDASGMTLDQWYARAGRMNARGLDAQLAVSNLERQPNPSSPITPPVPPAPPTPPITPPSLPPSTPTGPGLYPPAPKSNISVSETYNPRGYLQTRTITEKGLTDPITGEPMTQRQQEITEGRILADQESAEREKYKRQFQSSDTEQYRARRLDASGKPLGDVAGAKAQLDLVNKEIASMGSTTGMTSQQLDRYNTLLRRQADLSVDVAGKTRNLGGEILRHTLYIAQAALVWQTFRSVGQILDESITKQRELTLETAKFAAITGQSVDAAAEKWKMYADIGLQAGVSQSQLGRTGLIATQMGKGNVADESMFVRTTTQLEELTGVASSTIAESLSSALRQADKPMSEVAHLGDLIASSLQKIPAAELKDVISALQEAPALAQLWATDFDTAFNIIIEGASRAQEGPENVSGAFMRLSQGLNEIAGGGEKAWTRQNQLLDDFGLKVTDDAGRLRAIPEILKEAAAILPTLSAPRQQEFLSSIAGSTIKPDQLRTIIGGISAFAAALDNSSTKIAGTLTEMTDIIDQSLGQMVKVMDARIEMLRVRGGLLGNLLTSLARGTIGQYGGTEGVTVTNNIADAITSEKQGQEQKQEFLKDIIGRSTSVEEAVRLSQEHNQRVIDAVNKERQNFRVAINPFVTDYGRALIISPEDVKSAFEKGLGEVDKSVASSTNKDFSVIPDSYNRQNDLLLKRLQSRPIQSNLNQDPFAVRARGIMQKDLGGGQAGWSGESVLPTNQIDLTKYTQEEINQAKQLSIQLSMQELEIMRVKLAEMQLEPSVIDSAVAKRKEELDTAILLLRTQQGLSYETGITASKLQDALSQMDKQKQDQQSLFQFRRLKDIDPSQFGQLQGLTQMYDKFLTSIGSPEKQMDINLLMGEQNTFKTMNARMTALQLALEDLTKVEKAQLAGTWNLPSGATALVPIQSLDIQRWNKSGGSGFDPAALAGLMGATNQSGDKVSTAMGTAADRITAAIREQYRKAGITPTEDGVAKASKLAQEAIKAALGGIFGVPQLAAIGGEANLGTKDKPFTPKPGVDYTPIPQSSDFFTKLLQQLPPALNYSPSSQQNYSPMPQQNYSPIPSGFNDEGGKSGREMGAATVTSLVSGISSALSSLAMGGGLIGGAKHGEGMKGGVSKASAPPPVNVTMSALPLKAAFNANLSVVLNGQVLAQVMTPILYQLMIKMSSTTPTTGGGIGALR